MSFAEPGPCFFLIKATANFHSSAMPSSLRSLPREPSLTQQLQITTAMVAWIFISACTCTIWDWISITILFPTTTPAMARRIACFTIKEMRTFVETTEAAGLNADNDRYSFACAWGDSNSNGLPDLFVANDFGSSQLYRNNGEWDVFTSFQKRLMSRALEPGMSCCWADFDNDGHQDIYVPSMWEAAGQRVSGSKAVSSTGSGEYSRTLSAARARKRALSKPRRWNISRMLATRLELRWAAGPGLRTSGTLITTATSDLYVANGYLSGPEKERSGKFLLEASGRKVV